MFIPGLPLTVIMNGQSTRIGEILMPSDTERIIREIYSISGP